MADDSEDEITTAPSGQEGDVPAATGGPDAPQPADGHAHESGPEPEPESAQTDTSGDTSAEAADGNAADDPDSEPEAGEAPIESEDETGGEGAPPGKDSEDVEPDDENESGEGDMEEEELLPMTAVVEAILFAAREPLKPAQIARAVGKRIRQDAVRAAVEELNVHYLETGRAFEIAEISERYQLMSRPEYARHIMRIYPKRELQADKDKTGRLTPAAMDTLAIIAYKQPVMRSEIERIRGVACGPVLKMLIERGSVKQVGRRTDLVGKPAVFGTTEKFLAEFGLGSLDELPLRNDYLPAPGEEPQVELLPEEGSGGEAATPDTAPETAVDEEIATRAEGSAEPEGTETVEAVTGPETADGAASAEGGMDEGETPEAESARDEGEE